MRTRPDEGSAPGPDTVPGPDGRAAGTATAAPEAEREPGAAAGRGPFDWPGPSFDAADDAALLRLARAAIEAATGLRSLAADDIPASLPEATLGAFVTLTIDGELRGCMGRLDFERDLAENVVAAAFTVAHDPRFEPLRADEVALVRIEVSIISPPVPIPDAGAFDVSRHGIVVERGWRRALLLPQVARERGWSARRTLEAVCEKAGLDRDAWRRPDTVLSVFLAHEAIEPLPVVPAGG